MYVIWLIFRLNRDNKNKMLSPLTKVQLMQGQGHPSPRAKMPNCASPSPFMVCKLRESYPQQSLTCKNHCCHHYSCQPCNKRKAPPSLQ